MKLARVATRAFVKVKGMNSKYSPAFVSGLLSFVPMLRTSLKGRIICVDFKGWTLVLE